jgi:hypothetical protein
MRVSAKAVEASDFDVERLIKRSLKTKSGSIGDEAIYILQDRIAIEIDQRDIEASKGHEKDEGGCAMAQGACRLPGVNKALIHLSRIYLHFRGHKGWFMLQTPGSVRTELALFDRAGHKHFQLGRYEIPTLSPVETQKLVKGERAGGRTRRTLLRGRKPPLKRAKPHVMSGVRHFGANR